MNICALQLNCLIMFRKPDRRNNWDNNYDPTITVHFRPMTLLWYDRAHLTPGQGILSNP